MRRFKTWRRVRMAVVILLAGGVAGCLAACQPSPGEPQRLESPPSTAMESPEPAVPVPSGPAASPATPPGTTTPLLSAEAQAELDQELIVAAKANNVALVRELIGRGAS